MPPRLNTIPDHYLVLEEGLKGLVIVETSWALAYNLDRLIRNAVLYDDAINDFLTYLYPDQKRQLEQFLIRYGIFSSVVREQPLDAAFLRAHGLTAFCFTPYYGPVEHSFIKDGGPAQQVSSPQMQKIAAMSTTERVAELLYRAFFRAGGVLADGMTPQNLLKILLISAETLIALQYAPVGWGLDAALLALGVTMMVYGGLAAVRELISSVSVAMHATTDAQMDQAVALCADALATLGVSAVMGLLLHKTMPNSGGRAASEIQAEEIAPVRQAGEKITTKEAVAPVSKEITTADLLKQSTATKDELTNHLNYLKSIDRIKVRDVDLFKENNIWPEGQNIPKSSECLLPDGNYNWPVNDGFVLNDAGDPILKDVTLSPGEVMDRYGGEWGKFTAPLQSDGTPYDFPQRAMANIEDPRTYNQYVVLKEFTVQQGEIAPAFGDPGGGYQNVLPSSVKDLLESKTIEKL